VRALIAAAHVHVVIDIAAGVEQSDEDGTVTARLAGVGHRQRVEAWNRPPTIAC